MEPLNNPFYLDWSFWTVIASLIAIVLSQLPPVHVLIKKAKLDFEIYSKIMITHKVGNPNLQLHILINNIGGRKVRIKEINVSVEKDGRHIVTFPAQNYLQNQTDKNSVLLTTFSIAPGEEWGHVITCLNFFDRVTENEYRDIEAKLKSDFREKSKNLPKEHKELVELDSRYVDLVHIFFGKHFIWKAGEYSLTLNIVSDGNAANLSKKYRFTLFESHEEQLKSVSEYFKYGGGIWWDPDILTSCFIEIKEA